jgi:hypothetical protein
MTDALPLTAFHVHREHFTRPFETTLEIDTLGSSLIGIGEVASLPCRFEKHPTNDVLIGSSVTLTKGSAEREDRVLQFALIVPGGYRLIVEDLRMALSEVPKLGS